MARASRKQLEAASSGYGSADIVHFRWRKSLIHIGEMPRDANPSRVQVQLQPSLEFLPLLLHSPASNFSYMDSPSTARA